MGSTHQRKHDVDDRTQPAGRKQADDGADQSESHRPDSDAVQHEHHFAGQLDRPHSVLDGLGPFEIGQVDSRFQFTLNDTRRVEMEQPGLVGAVCHVLARAGGQVGNRTRGIEAFAVVQYVCGVEVMDIQLFGDVRNGLIEIFLDGRFDGVENLRG